MEKGVPIRSVSRTISVLQAINRYGSLSMTAISRHEALPYPTVFRIVQTLLHEGLIEQESARKHYRPTALVQSLANGYQDDSYLVDLARDEIRALTRQVGWPVFIAVRVGGHMVIRDATHSETSLTFHVCHPGAVLPLFTSGTGQVFLSQMPPSEYEDLVRWAGQGMDEEGPALDFKEIAGALDKVRAARFAAMPCRNQRPNKTGSLAVPIFRDGRIEAVLTLTHFATMKSSTVVERHLGAMKKAADVISDAVSMPRRLTG